jgi:hypothetical protein
VKLTIRRQLVSSQQNVDLRLHYPTLLQGAVLSHRDNFTSFYSLPMRVGSLEIIAVERTLNLSRNSVRRMEWPYDICGGIMAAGHVANVDNI